MRRTQVLAIAAVLLGLWAAQPARAQDHNLGRMYYYPYYYFPHSYWPTMSKPWPERIGEPYQRPPAYMAYPAFPEPHWRYDMQEPMKYYRGFHFWLDHF